MSAISGGPTASRRSRAGAIQVQAAPAAIGTVTVAWTLSRQALRAGTPSGPLASLLFEGRFSEQGPDLELSWTLDLDEARASLVLQDPSITSPITLIDNAALTCMHDEGLLHVEASLERTTLLKATLRPQPGIQLLYASTVALSMLGLRGGRYEVVR